MTLFQILILVGTPTIIVFPFIVGHLLWRKKYFDRKTGWHKCGVCGAVTDPIYFVDGIFCRRYHCEEHFDEYEKDKRRKKKKKN